MQKVSLQSGVSRLPAFTTLPERWWETAAAMARPYLKLHGDDI